MSKKEIIEMIKEDIKVLYKNESSGHDYDHSIRVLNNSLLINKKENCDEFIISLASLLHDVDDPKVFKTENYKNARTILGKYNIEMDIINRVIDVISTISFKGDNSNRPNTIEGKVVQDADRLDAIGAIGIARAFTYGGYHQRKMYDPEILPRDKMSIEEYRSSNGTTINHFYEKLLKLENTMNTESAKEIAKVRTEFLNEYLDRFIDEWNGER